MSGTFNVDGGEHADDPTHSKPEEVVRRRGRPFGSKNRDPLSAQAPPAADASGANTSAPKARKRRSKPVDLDDMAKQIQGTHELLALMTGIAEMQVSEKESQMLARAMADVAREFDIAPNGRATAAIQLIGVSAIIYLPRFAVLKAKMDQKKRRGPVTVEGEKTEVPNGTPAAN